MRDKQQVFTADEVYGILIEHGQHDERFKLGEIIKYSPNEALEILLKETNGDRFRSMTDEQIAEFLDNFGRFCTCCNKHPVTCDKECYDGYLKWLKQEAQEDELPIRAEQGDA